MNEPYCFLTLCKDLMYVNGIFLLIETENNTLTMQLQDIKNKTNPCFGGYLADHHIIGLRNFLTDIIKERELKRKPSH